MSGSTSLPGPRNITSFFKSLKHADIDSSIEKFISLLKRRQIRNSRPCALATAELLLRVVAVSKTREHEALVRRVRQVGQRLVAAQPRELAIGNIVRRVLGVVREVGEQEDNRAIAHDEPRPQTTTTTTTTTTQQPVSLFGLLCGPNNEQFQTPPSGAQSPVTSTSKKLDIKAEVIDGIKFILSELESVDADIAPYATEHIHNDEIILTHTSSRTVQKFLLAAARKRKFTVVHVESYPNDHLDTHGVIMRHEGGGGGGGGDENRWKALTAAGITVIMLPDSAVFALMSRVNKVILTPHSVLANGGLIAASGAMIIASAAKAHQTPVVVVSGTYKLSPVHHFDTSKLIEYGDPGKVVGFDQGDFVEHVDVFNPLSDYVPAELVDLYITNLGGHAPSFLYRIVAEHYRAEDVDLS